MKIIACIPARYGSTRFEDKVLAAETGKFLVEHTYQAVSRARLVDKVIIAADDERIMKAVKGFAQCVMTDPGHQSGTDRIAQAVKEIDADIVINVQADEPEIDPGHIDLLAKMMADNPDCPMGTLVSGFENAEQVENPNIVKVVTDKSARAIYFSRSVIPYNKDAGGVGDAGRYLQHVGIYAYRKGFLLKITSLEQSELEKQEKLEQLRVIENGYEILTAKVDYSCEGIDTPEQYAEFVKRWKTLRQ
jgi:3-deoxy-manno-octulosonate cytidylyltransferase (CMP-KDO synthetase)